MFLYVIKGTILEDFVEDTIVNLEKLLGEGDRKVSKGWIDSKRT